MYIYSQTCITWNMKGSDIHHINVMAIVHSNILKKGTIYGSISACYIQVCLYSRLGMIV